MTTPPGPGADLYVLPALLRALRGPRGHRTRCHGAVWVLDLLAPALGEEGLWTLSVCHGCSGPHQGGRGADCGVLTPHLHSIEGDAEAGGFDFWPISVVLTVELCQRPMVLQGRVEKLLGSSAAVCWEDGLSPLVTCPSGMVWGFSVFRVFSAEVRGQCPCDCQLVCAYVGGGGSVCTM